MKPIHLFGFGLFALLILSFNTFRFAEGKGEAPKVTVSADNKNIQYTGRIDFTNPKKPKFWTAGVYVKAKFKGSYCDLVINDQILWGHYHNYLEIVIDNKKPFRIQTTGPTNTIRVAEGLPEGTHTLTICKDTDSSIGYLEFVGLRCQGIVPLPRKPKHMLEFIGDSITSGAGSDQSKAPCGKGEWYDQNNAYTSYGPTTARLLNAQWHLSSLGGIGMMHSCCDMKVTMPDVFDKFDFTTNKGVDWNFKRYQPDAVTVCLGQNDGLQNADAYHTTYVRFLQRLRSVYPKANIICLTSPMADAGLTAGMKSNITRIVAERNKSGDTKVHAFFFSRSYNRGCGGHPDVDDHQLIAKELAVYLKSTLGW